jgi:transporter family protein
MWVMYALGSALFAGITAILAKAGIKETSSNVATAIRTVVVLLFAWLMVLVVGSQDTTATISSKTLIFLVLSGLATGASWLCYFRALQLGDINKVVPVDKSSIILTVLLAIIFLGETENLGVKLAGIAVIGLGTYLMIQKRPGVTKTVVGNRWLVYAALSAVFASLTSILGKIGISGVESNLGTAIRTIVVLVMA